MAIQEINVCERERWDSLVRTFPNYDVYWLNGYVKAFQIHGDGEPQLIYYEDKGSALRGINVVMKRDIAKDPRFNGIFEPGTYFDYSTPYGYGGWLLDNPSGSGTEKLFNEYNRFCIDHNIISEFVRFHPLVKNHESVTPFYEIVPLGEVVAVDLSAPETIWNNFTSKNRNMVRKAMKSGIKIYQGRYPEIYEEFRSIYNRTMDKDNAVKYYYFEPKFYESLLDDLPNHAQVYYAQNPEGKIIAASIMLIANGKMNYHLSGSLKEYSQLAPTNLLLYEAALWGCENNCKTLLLGGGVGSGEDSLFKFKRAFYKGDLARFYIGKRIFNAEINHELVDIRKQSCPMIVQSTYFPTYRAPEIAGGGGII